MINILLEGYDINAPWLFDTLKRYLKPSHKVAVVALAFRDSVVKDLDDWNALYAKNGGCYYSGIVGSLAAYGITERQIRFINYFSDTPETANHTIRDADILYFPGGLPDRMMQRIREMQIYDSILQHKGIVLGYSAGAVIQLREYHLSPDRDYPRFGYYEGFPFLDDFYLEVHYDGAPEQVASIERVLRERQKPVYATHEMGGAIVEENGNLECIGNVSVFDVPYSVEPAKEADLAGIAALAARMWEHPTEELYTEFTALLTRPDAALFAARNSEQLIGFAQCQLRHDYVEGTDSSPVAYLEGIFVEERFRRKGVASSLLRACEAWAKAQGCSEFASDCKLDNAESLRFHLGLGFTESNRIICFTKQLQGD